MNAGIRLFGKLCLFLLAAMVYDYSGLHLVVYNSLQSFSGGIKTRQLADKFIQDHLEEVISSCQRIRLERFNRKCICLRRKYNLSRLADFANFNSFDGIIDDAHKFILEVYPKTGSTSWKIALYNNTKHAFLNPQKFKNPAYIPQNIHGAVTLYGLHNLRDEPSVKGALSKLKDYFVTINVRHPLKRLESAYKDKFFRQTSYEIDYLNRLHRDPDKANSSEAMDNRVTFQEFLDHVLDDRPLNGHWKPFWHFHVCSQDVNYIAKTETTLLDMSYIIDNHLSKKGAPVHIHMSEDDGRQLYSSIDLPFFSSLSEPGSYISRLTEFHEDSLLFGYTHSIDSSGRVTGSCKDVVNGVCC